MRSSLRRIAVFGVVVAASGLIGGAAFGLGEEVSRDHGGPVAGHDIVVPGGLDREVWYLVGGAEQTVWYIGDRYLGIGGVNPGPLPGPTPGLHPEHLINGAIQTIAQVGSDVAQGLGGVVVGPIPSPTPGIEPDPGGRNTRVVNMAIQTGAKAIGNAAQGLGGVVVGPIPTPTPGLIPVPEISRRP